MKNIINTERIPIKTWATDLDDGAIKQAKTLANLPFAFKHIAIMPDSHQGYGMPIGAVLATKNVVIPNAVGVDIGCGMCAVKTSLTHIDKEVLCLIVEDIKKSIPVGFNKHTSEQDYRLIPQLKNEESIEEADDTLFCGQTPIVHREFRNSLLQIGTLGGGNHFLEIQEGDDGHIWIMVHSGSRNLGKQVCDYYNKLAVELNNKYYSSVTKDMGLAFLPLDTDEAEMYLEEMNYCLEFALANRKLMKDRILECFNKHIETKELEFYNKCHNYATMENHYGENVLVHRKGATSAKSGEIGMIPGSQGSKSYIVEGLGNNESFSSCSHGAGRKMGRNEARESLNIDDEINVLNALGVIHNVTKQEDLDECPSAYKDIDVVMNNQNDLCKILVELTPLAVIKG